MKKFLLILAVLSLAFTVSCGRASVDPTAPEAIDFGFSEEELSTVFYRDIAGDFFIDLSENAVALGILSELSYFDTTDTNHEESVGKFEIAIGTNTITVYNDGTVTYDNGVNEAKTVEIDGDEFEYFYSITVGNVTSVGQYDNSAEIVVYNSKNMICEIEENEEFFENLNEVKVIKLSNGGDYSLSNEEYKISIDNKVIKIYDDFIKIGSDVYAVLDGDFGFLSELSYYYSSGGFLPDV